MFRFSEDQDVVDINGVKVGGQPGEYPTAMVGSIFYEGQKVVEDGQKGTFDEERAREILQEEKEVSENTGLPRIIDVVGGSSEALIKYIDFVAEETNAPFLIDGTSPEVRIPAVEHVDEVGLADRAIYNSINIECGDEEIEAIKKSDIETTILLCFNPKQPTIDGRMESLEKTIDLADEAGIENRIADPSVLDLPEPGLVSKTIYRIKDEYGIPAGAGTHNAVDMWDGRTDMSRESYLLRTAIANSFPIVLGADFVLYGPNDDADEMYNVCSLTDAYVSYSMKMEEGISPKVKDSPISKIFRF